MMQKSFKSIFWDIPEPEYRKHPALSQSSISAYERGGFESIKTLFEHRETTSFTFGSAVDCLITEGDRAFSDRYFISDLPKISPVAEPIIKEVYSQFHNAYTNINDIPDTLLMPILSQAGYKGNTNWGTAAKCKAIRQDGAQYYQTMFMAGGKTILSQDVYNRVFACVRSLKDSPQTRQYFKDDDPFDGIERCYQMKFKGILEGREFRGMSDLLICDHNNRVVTPVDLKSSHNMEYNFPKSFMEFRYDIQARLYWRLIRSLMDSDDVFRDYKLYPFRFIVVNNFSSPAPLVWVFGQTSVSGTIEIGGRKLRDPVTIGKELYHHLENNSEFPLGISLDSPNIIEKWFDR